MLHESELESDVVVDDGKVTISIDKYQTMVKNLEDRDIKLKATRNLHQIIVTKDHELKEKNEKVQNLQSALDKAEMRLANQIRLSVTGRSFQPSSDEYLSTQRSVPPQLEDISNISGRQPASNAKSSSVTATSDLETDCAGPVESPARIGSHGQFSAIQSFGHISKSRPEGSSYSIADRDSEGSVSLQSRGCKVSQPSFQSVKADSLLSVDPAEKSSISIDPSLQSVKPVGVSKDLISKLMQQNVRLKKVVRDILSQRGASVSEYLDSQEVSDVVEQLREELRLSKVQIEKLKDAISAKDSEDIVKKYADLMENYQKLKKMATVSQAMADAYCKEFERLKQENKELKEQQSRKSTERHEQASDSVDQTMKSVAQLEEKLKLAKLDHNASQLQYEKQAKVLLEKETELLELGKCCEGLESDKHLLQNQIAIFQEDFHAERKANEEKTKQQEAALAKHQDWIRKLVAEAQKCRGLYDEEQRKRIQAETELGNVSARFRDHITQSRSDTTRCGTSASSGNWFGHHSTLQDLQVDNGPESTQSHDFVSARDSSFGKSVESPQGLNKLLVCPRCEREFEAKDEQKWREHCARCTDD